MKKNYFILLGLFLLLPLAMMPLAAAHCPLCTIGAAAAAGGAKMLGVNDAAIGVFLGAFAVSMGWMFSNMIKKKYVKGQKWILIIGSFISTILPILSFFEQQQPLTIYWFGDYGSLFYRVYMIDTFLVGSLLGGALLFVTPSISRWLSKQRQGKMIPYQGMGITFLLLALVGAILQLAL